MPKSLLSKAGDLAEILLKQRLQHIFLMNFENIFKKFFFTGHFQVTASDI